MKRQHVAGLVAAATGAVFLCLSAPDAVAQFGGLFGDPPPRPPPAVSAPHSNSPSSAPRNSSSSNLAIPISVRSAPAATGSAAAQERIPPGPPPLRARRRPRQVESEPLPPPGAGSPRLPPGVKPPRGPPQPANTAPQPGDEVVSAPPVQKIPNRQAVFSGLDKITGRIINFEVALGETVQFGALQVVPRVCYTRPPTEAAATDAFVEVERSHPAG